ncbi:MAG TPA: DUF4190 domain-containing protein [Candidatus Angelobacter sp.]
MFCTKCGSKITEDAASCPGCGKVLRNAGQDPPSPAPPGAPGSSQPQPESKALPSLVLGILALPFSIVAGIPAIILGRLSLAEIKQSSGTLTGEGMARAGLVLGCISIALVPFLLIIAIPNLQHSKTEANQAAAATVRSLVDAQAAYSTTYPKAGYAPDLATLGPGAPSCAGEGIQRNACLIDGELGCITGTSGQWCDKDQYRYSIVGINKDGVTQDYIITSTPMTGSAGNISYCASSDGAVKSRAGAPLAAPLKTVAECKPWQPVWRTATPDCRCVPPRTFLFFRIR